VIPPTRDFVFYAALGLVFCGSAAQADPPDSAVPNFSALDNIGRQTYAKGKAPGFAMLVWSHGRVVFANGYGFADAASKTAATPETRFVIGSLTKQFTAAAVLLLAEKGAVSLDDPLSKYLPQLPNAGTITLRMLLNQTSGLHNYPNTREHDWPASGTIPPEKIFAILQKDKPDFAPGERWQYSNTNYAALAGVVARASGMTYFDFLRKNIFSPLGMASSGSGFAAQSDAATPYDGQPGSIHPTPRRLSLDLFYGAGSIVSAAQDMAKWDAALIAGRLLNPQSMHALWTPGMLPNGTPIRYAMGFVPDEIGGHREVWHNGYTPMAGGYCYNAIFPDDQLAVVVLSNASEGLFRGEPESMVRQVLALYDPSVRP
jgi:D-alanyl-D-alanine carboxypeptidase